MSEVRRSVVLKGWGQPALPTYPDGPSLGRDERLGVLGLSGNVNLVSLSVTDGMVFGDSPTSVQTFSFSLTDGMLFTDTANRTLFRKEDFDHVECTVIIDDAIVLDVYVD